MRGRSLVVMAVLVAVLGAFIWFVERDLPTTTERTTQGKRVFGDLEADEVREIAIEQGGRTVRLAREAPAAAPGQEDDGEDEEEGEGEDDLAATAAAEWRLTAPIVARADRFAVDGLLSTLLAIEKGRTLEGIDRAAYGLAPPAARVTLTTVEGPRVLEVGREVPGSDQRIVALAGGTEGWAAGGAFWDELVKPAGDWRSRDLFPGQRAEIERITLRQGGASVLLARRGEEFWVEAPFTDRADGERVEELLGALTGLRAEEFLDAPPPGLEPPEATVEVVRRGRAEPFRVALGAAPAPAAAPTPEATPDETGADLDEPVPAAAPARPARVGGQLVTVAADALAEAAARPAAEWRSRAWTSFAVYEVDRLELTDAAGRLTLARAEGDWTRTSPSGEEARIFYGPVSDLLSALVEARAEGVRDGSAPAGPAVLTARLASGDGEGAREQTLTLYAGAGGVVARANDRQALLAMPASLLPDLRSKLEAVRTAEPLESAATPGPTPPG